MATSLKELIVTFQANAKPVISALNQIDAKLQHTTRSLRSTGESFTRLGKEIGLTLSLPIAALGGASLKAAADIQSLEASLTSVLAKFDTGLSIEQAVSNEIEHLKDVTNELGVSFSASVGPYTRYLAASKDSLETNRKVIRSFLGLSAGLGLTTQDVDRVIRALEQMQSKGKVMAEELKLQLGDAVPGAVGLFAEAMNVTEAELFKMMEQGEVSSSVLADVANTIDKKYGAAIDKGSKTIRANTNRIANAFYMLRVNVGRGMDETFKINDKMAAFAEWLTKVSNNFARLDENGKKVILSIGLFLAVVGPLLIALGAIARILSFAVLGFNLLIKPILLLVNFLPKIIAGFRLLGLVMAANPLGAFIAATSIIIIYWKEIVGLFEKAMDWLSKISLSGVWEKFKDFAGFGDAKIDAGATNAISTPQTTSNVLTNQRTVNNNLTVNIPPGMSAGDATSVKAAVKQALEEENRQTYIELGAQ
jgi:tape measure domain-containing protein